MCNCTVTSSLGKELFCTLYGPPGMTLPFVINCCVAMSESARADGRRALKA
jgi:hypothetical protein